MTLRFMAAASLRDQVLDPQWVSFNYTLLPRNNDAVIQGLNQVMTPPFGAGSRLVWLVNTTLCQHCSEDLLVKTLDGDSGKLVYC